MSKLDNQLNRLLRAAAAAPRSVSTELPFRVEARVLAAWRASRSEPDPVGILHLLRQGLALASVITALAVGGTYWQINRVANDVWTMPNAVVRAASLQ